MVKRAVAASMLFPVERLLLGIVIFDSFFFLAPRCRLGHGPLEIPYVAAKKILVSIPGLAVKLLVDPHVRRTKKKEVPDYAT